MCGSLTGLEVELGCGAWSVGRDKRDSSAGLGCLTSEVKLDAPYSTFVRFQTGTVMVALACRR